MYNLNTKIDTKDCIMCLTNLKITQKIANIA